LTAPLGAVHRKVGAPQEFTPAVLFRDTDRGRDLYLSDMGQPEWIGERGCDRVRDLLLRSSISNEESEFITAESGEGPIPLEGTGETKGCLPEQFIASTMPVIVIDRLEAV